MREIPTKNYFILAILSILTVVLVLAFFNIYRNYDKNKESYLSQNIINISCKDIKDLLVENNTLFIYIDNIANIDDEEQEKKLLDELNEYDLKKHFVFLDNSDKQNINYFKEKYNIDIKNKKILVIFEDGKRSSYKLGDDFEKEVIRLAISSGAFND